MVTQTELAVGIVLPIVGGFLNSVWNLPGNVATSDMIRVVRRPAEESGWCWEHFWMVNQGVSIVLNLAYILPHLGVDNLHHAIVSSSSSGLAAIIVASFTWGFGTIGFGLALRLVGIGLGTALCMSVIVIMGVVWGFIFGGGVPTGAAGALILTGVVVAIIGFGMLGRAVHLREVGRTRRSETSGESKQEHGSGQEMSCASTNLGIDMKEVDESMKFVVVEPSSPNFPASSKSAFAAEGGGEAERRPEEPRRRTLSPLQSVGFCMVAGIFASSLQLAFVIGDSLTQQLLALGISKLFAQDAIWLFAFCLAGVVNCSYAGFLITRKQNWAEFVRPDERLLISWRNSILSGARLR
mmetsp:Transcript_41185/g.129367  ORF Transcript_41185/g.129367 Transcript_41185/m.129367 type:complete len:353 (-) Transcript_41185:164-1222(-)